MSHRQLDPDDIRPYCPYYAAAMDTLSRRWAATVLRALLGGATRFSDIAAAVPGMTDKLLSQRLKDLEADGLVERHVRSAAPVRVDYRLTEKGAALGAVLLDLNRWALEWITLPAAPPEDQE
ncbi:winged helix-turn-helix transcriptional regulator [Streptosporangium sp. NPDC001559]|uniref:winged helix-turn-helix transcriptional regulator n=1 Tax=Streptosporangium sp. NPDC001559 TaxID=3366187 RepID=UPI0036EB1DFC